MAGAGPRDGNFGGRFREIVSDFTSSLFAARPLPAIPLDPRLDYLRHTDGVKKIRIGRISNRPTIISIDSIHFPGSDTSA